MSDATCVGTKSVSRPSPRVLLLKEKTLKRRRVSSSYSIFGPRHLSGTHGCVKGKEESGRKSSVELRRRARTEPGPRVESCRPFRCKVT